MSEKMDRRGFWRALLREALPSLPPEGPVAPRRPGLVPIPLRPPGAAPGEAFLERCAPACRVCVDACPAYAIVPSYQDHQPGGGDGRPYLMPDRQACLLCGLCMLACPTGALVPTVPPAVRIGLAVLDETVCVRSHGEACGICLERCPFPGVAIGEGAAFPEIVAAHCTGCGLCSESCPTHALVVTARP